MCVWGAVEAPSAVMPLIELEFRGENERVALDDRKPLTPYFRVLAPRSTGDLKGEHKPSEAVLETEII